MIAKLPFIKHLGMLALSSFILLTSCEKVDAGGEKVTERYEIEDFEKIEFHIGGQLNYTQGNQTQVSVTTSQEALAGIDIYVKNKTLHIKRKSGYNILNQEEITIDVMDDDTYQIVTCGSGDVFADFDENYHFTEHNLKTSGSGSIHADYVRTDEQFSKISGSGDISIDYISATQQEAVISGSGSISVFELIATDATAHISGSGNVHFVGQSEQSDVDIHGSGEFQGYDFESNNTDAFNCGSGSISVRVKNNLDVELSGSGNLFYKGYPSISSSVSGSGDIINAN